MDTCIPMDYLAWDCEKYKIITIFPNKTLLMQKLSPTLGLRSSIFLVISIVIGSGVFKKVAVMSSILKSPGLVILCWALAGFISLMGALCNAEIACMFANSGGE